MPLTLPHCPSGRAYQWSACSRCQGWGPRADPTPSSSQGWGVCQGLCPLSCSLRVWLPTPLLSPSVPLLLAGLGSHLEHRVGEEGLQCPLLAVRLGLVVLQQLVEVTVLLAVRQDLQAVLVVAHKLLVDVEHGQQDVEQVGWKEGGGQRVTDGTLGGPILQALGPPVSPEARARARVKSAPQRDPCLWG